LTQAIHEVNTLRVHELEHTADPRANRVPLLAREQDMIQNVNTDIDNFIQNAKIIQDSINEAMNYQGMADPQLREEVFRTSLKFQPTLEEIQDVSYESNRDEDKRQYKHTPTKVRGFESPLVPHEDVNLHQIRSIGRDEEKFHDHSNKENRNEEVFEIAQSSSDEQT
jgi:hypothetical protein